MGSTYGFCTKHPTCTLSGVSCAVCEALAQLADLRAKLDAARKLHPAENIALTVARSQVDRGENPPINTTTMLVMALDRISGNRDWTAEDECPAGGPHTISHPDDTECVECGARRPEPLSTSEPE